MPHRNLIAPALVAAFVLAVALPAAAAWEKNTGLNDVLLDGGIENLETAATTDGAGGLLTFAIRQDTGTGAAEIVMTHTLADGTAPAGTAGTVIVQPTWNMISTGSTDIQALADGQGGAYLLVRFFDATAAHTDQRVFRYRGDGSVTGAPDGAGLNSRELSLTEGRMVRDGRGGLIVVAQEQIAAQNDYDIVAQRFDGNLARVWGRDGVVVCGRSDVSLRPVVAADGTGGVYVAWRDLTGGLIDESVFADHILNDGTSGWALNGIDLRWASPTAQDAAIAPDGLGGVLFAYEANGDIQVMRYRPDGSRVFETLLSDYPTDASGDRQPIIVGDGAGGAFVLWEATGLPQSTSKAQRLAPSGQELWSEGGVQVLSTVGFNGGFSADARAFAGGLLVAQMDRISDVRVQQVDAGGTIVWGTAGLLACNAGGSQSGPVLHDGEDEAFFVSFNDSRDGSGIAGRSVQRFDRWGVAGDPRPQIVAVDDFPQDQGGRLVVAWTASDRDVFGDALVHDYSVWRRRGDAVGALSSPAREFLADRALASGLDPQQAATLAASGWEYLATQPAILVPAYSLAVASYGDSTAAGSPVTEVMVIAQADPPVAFLSLPLGGTSTDDLAPTAPQTVVAVRTDADVQVVWTAPSGPLDDLGEYRVYRGATADFPLDETSLVAAVADPTLIDVGPGGGTLYYRVTAVDVHGNEGPASPAAAVSGVAAAPAPDALVSALQGNRPNPFNPRTEIRFTLAQAGPVRVDILDLRGHRVASLLAEPRPAGEHRLVWDGRDDHGGGVASGTYLVRLVTEGVTDVRKLMLVR